MAKTRACVAWGLGAFLLGPVLCGAQGPDPVLSLSGGRFHATLTWRLSADQPYQDAHARALTNESGFFWFFGADRAEVTVKVVDGRAVNGKWWVFAASMTSLDYELEIVHLSDSCALDFNPDCAVRTYRQEAGNRNVLDVEAFADEPFSEPPTGQLVAVATGPRIELLPAAPIVGQPLAVTVSVDSAIDPEIEPMELVDNRIRFAYQTFGFPGFPPPLRRWTKTFFVDAPLPPGTYVLELLANVFNLVATRTFDVAPPSPDFTLAVEGYQFRVTAGFDDPWDGTSELVPAQGRQLTAESGYFSFFSPDNVELTVKILNGSGVNGRFWVFIAGMTDVATEVAVERCPPAGLPEPCTVKRYRTAAGVNRNFLDTEAFP